MKPLKQKEKSGWREPLRDLRGGLSKDRIITVSSSLFGLKNVLHFGGVVTI